MKANGEIDRSIVEDLMSKGIWKDYNKETITHFFPVFGCLDVNYQTELEYNAEKEQEWVNQNRSPRKKIRLKEEDRVKIIKNKIHMFYFFMVVTMDIYL